jgi:hypothetical protein
MFIATVVCSSTNETFNVHRKLRHILGSFTNQLATFSPIFSDRQSVGVKQRDPHQTDISDILYFRIFLLKYVGDLIRKLQIQVAT